LDDRWYLTPARVSDNLIFIKYFRVKPEAPIKDPEEEKQKSVLTFKNIKSENDYSQHQKNLDYLLSPKIKKRSLTKDRMSLSFDKKNIQELARGLSSENKKNIQKGPESTPKSVLITNKKSTFSNENGKHIKP
jgi:hypothetical protein